MGRFRGWLYRFMSGRYGTDDLSRFLLIAYLLCFVLSFVWQFFEKTLWLALLTELAMWGLMVWSLFRILSRNHNKRWNENQRFLALRTQVREWIKLTRARLRDVRTKRYRRCPHCRAVVRFPIKRGIHIVSCPCCKQKFELKIRL